MFFVLKNHNIFHKLKFCSNNHFYHVRFARSLRTQCFVKTINSASKIYQLPTKRENNIGERKTGENVSNVRAIFHVAWEMRLFLGRKHFAFSLVSWRVPVQRHLETNFWENEKTCEENMIKKRRKRKRRRWLWERLKHFDINFKWEKSRSLETNQWNLRCLKISENIEKYNIVLRIFCG